MCLTAIPLQDGCAVRLHRTLRIPDDWRDYPLPPSLGPMELHRVGDGRYVVPMPRSGAVWLGFEVASWGPGFALKVGVGGIDAVSGETFAPNRLGDDPQDYLVLPDQPWLD